MTNPSEDFEKTVIDTIIELAKRSSMNFAQFARKAYSHTYGDETAVTKWRKQRREEKPQALTMADLFLCSQALGTDPENIVFQAHAKHKLQKK